MRRRFFHSRKPLSPGSRVILFLTGLIVSIFLAKFLVIAVPVVFFSIMVLIVLILNFDFLYIHYTDIYMSNTMATPQIISSVLPTAYVTVYPNAGVSLPNAS